MATEKQSILIRKCYLNNNNNKINAIIIIIISANAFS